jgi:uncharacterized protein (DUF1778 family)
MWRTPVLMAETKNQRVDLRVAARDDELFRTATAAANESLYEFLVESGRERAERVLADRTRFALSRRSGEGHRAVDRPPREIPDPVELFRRRVLSGAGVRRAGAAGPGLRPRGRRLRQRDPKIPACGRRGCRSGGQELTVATSVTALRRGLFLF